MINVAGDKNMIKWHIVFKQNLALWQPFLPNFLFFIIKNLIKYTNVQIVFHKI